MRGSTLPKVLPHFPALVVALAAGALAGCGGQTPESILAEVGDRRITVGDYLDSYQRLKPEDRPKLETEEARREFLQDLVNKELMELAALEKYPELPEQQGWRFTRYRWSQLETVLGRYLVEKQVHVTEAEKDEAYRFRTRDVLLDVIALPTREMGVTLMERLKAGASFEDLALEYSVEESADPAHPGRVGWVAWGTYAWTVERPVWAAAPGEVVGPVEDLKRQTWYLARATESREVPAEGSREELDEILDMQIREPLYLARQKAVQDSLREHAGVTYDPDGESLMMKKFYWEPPEELKDDPMAFLNDSRIIPTLEAAEESVTVIDYATLPDWTAKEFLERLSWYPTGLWPRGQLVEQLHEVYNMVIRDFLLRKAAEDYGLDKRPDFLEAVDRKGREMRVNLLYHRDIIADVNPSKDEILAWFEEHRERYKSPPSFKVSTFASKDRAVIERLRDDWRGGARFGELREKYGPQASDLEGMGESAWLSAGSDPPLDEMIAALKEGDVSDLFTRGDVHYVIQLVGRRAERLVPYEEAKQYVDEDVKNTFREDRLKAFLKEKEAKFGVRIRDRELQKVEIPAGSGTSGKPA